MPLFNLLRPTDWTHLLWKPQAPWSLVGCFHFKTLKPHPVGQTIQTMNFVHKPPKVAMPAMILEVFRGAKYRISEAVKVAATTASCMALGL